MAERKKPHLVQNLKKILVGLKFEGDDVRPLEEPMIEEKDEDVFDSDEENSDDDDDEEGKEGAVDEDSAVDLANASAATAVFSKSLSLKAKSGNDSDTSYLTDSDSEVEQVMKPSGKKNKLGSVEVVKTPVKKQGFVPPERGFDEDESSDEDEEGPNAKKGKRVSDGLTSKQRRAIDREQKRKKIGSNFYEVANVKNRNRERKSPKDSSARKKK